MNTVVPLPDPVPAITLISATAAEIYLRLLIAPVTRILDPRPAATRGEMRVRADVTRDRQVKLARVRADAGAVARALRREPAVALSRLVRTAERRRRRPCEPERSCRMVAPGAAATTPVDTRLPPATGTTVRYLRTDAGSRIERQIGPRA